MREKSLGIERDFLFHGSWKLEFEWEQTPTEFEDGAKYSKCIGKNARGNFMFACISDNVDEGISVALSPRNKSYRRELSLVKK